MTKRLDAKRLALWRELHHALADADRYVAGELAAETGLELSSFEVLALLVDHGGRARMQELSGALVINRSTFTRIVDRLHAQGLVSRELTDDDGRGVVAVLTRKGERTYLRGRPAYRRAVQRRFARHLTETDIAALGRIINKLEHPEE